MDMSSVFKENNFCFFALWGISGSKLELESMLNILGH